MARALGLGPRGREFESRIPEIVHYMCFDVVMVKVCQNRQYCTSPEGLCDLIICCKYNDSLRIYYVQHIGFEESDSIISLKLLTTILIEISILFKILQKTLAFHIQICMLVVR